MTKMKIMTFIRNFVTFGTLEENDTTYGAMMSSSVSATRIVATGFLKQTGQFSFIKMHDAEKGILIV